NNNSINICIRCTNHTITYYKHLSLPDAFPIYTMTHENAPRDPDTAGIQQKIVAHLGGTVTRIEQLPRWRPSWNVDVSLEDGSALRLHVRGERGAGLETQPLDMEMRILQILF